MAEIAGPMVLREPFSIVARCHCVQCRKASGAEYATNASVLRENFEVVRGEERVRHFESSEGNFRHFCGQCGSPLYKTVDADTTKVRLRLGCLDDSIDEQVGWPVMEIVFDVRETIAMKSRTHIRKLQG